MKTGNFTRTALLLLCAFAAMFILGCSGGDSGGGGGDVPIPTPTSTGTINNDNAQKMAYNAFKMTKANPSSAYNPELDNKNDLLTLAVNDINAQIDAGRISGQINKIITDPYDGEGTIVMSGTYSFDASTRDWNATLSMVYDNIHISIPEYTPSDFNASGTLNVVVDFNRTEGTMNATLSYAGYHLDNGITKYEYTGNVVQEGTLVDKELASYTSQTSVTTSATTTEGTGSMVAVCETKVTLDAQTGEATVSVTGTMTYTDFDGTGGVVIIDTATPIKITTSGDFTEGSMTVTDIYGNTITVEITGSNEIAIILNSYTLFSGNLEDFYVPIDVPPYF